MSACAHNERHSVLAKQALLNGERFLQITALNLHDQPSSGVVQPGGGDDQKPPENNPVHDVPNKLINAPLLALLYIQRTPSFRRISNEPSRCTHLEHIPLQHNGYSRATDPMNIRHFIQ
jgi:hypothetical protein